MVWHRLPFVVVALLGLLANHSLQVSAGESEPTSAESEVVPVDAATIEAGRELFEREWIANDPRSPKGDGLGPLFNDTSCAACHNQGGVGGAGSAAKNVHLIVSEIAGKLPKPQLEIAKEKLAAIHPGLRPNVSLVIHRFSTSPTYFAWRNRMDGVHERAPVAGIPVPGLPAAGVPVPFGVFGLPNGEPNEGAIEGNRLREMLKFHVQAAATKRTGATIGDGQHVALTERNTPALFGSGLIDSIPESVIVAAAKNVDPKWPTVRGRVARGEDGRIGRFGWKGDVASLRDFVAQACSIELGLNLEDHPQAIDPEHPDAKPRGVDMTNEEVNQLSHFLASLPQPREQESSHEAIKAKVAAGRDHFTHVGCAACHRVRLGDVWNIYSDLLLHDMGHDLANNGQYSSHIQAMLQGKPPAKKKKAKVEPVVAENSQWRTPPLWGLRDSAPYLHDGRAATVEQAIALHAGEADASAKAYFALEAEQRSEVQMFLRTLVAP